jgi:hypothetical protein
MKRIIAAGSIAALAMVGLAGTASAAPAQGAGNGGKPAGVTCQQFGHSVLRDTGALTVLAKEGLTFGGTTYSLAEVLAIHRTDTATANVVLKAVGPSLLPPGTDLGPVVAAIDAACPA